MGLCEFAIIRDYFADLDLGCEHVQQGVGDDCALLAPPAAGHQLALSSDTLIGGVHFFDQADADDVAKRALAVNLSDLCAMGAEPLGFSLAITLPAIEAHWLEKFAFGLGQQAMRYRIPLIGGDTTRGPLSLSIHIIGQVPQGEALLRGGAKEGDAIYISGTLGDGAAALHVMRNSAHDIDESYLMQRFYDPQIDFDLGYALRGKANAAIDVSDGLLADLGHILTASRVAAVVNVDDVPRSAELLRVGTKQQQLDWSLAGGDDYRLLFTMPESFAGVLQQQGFELTCIGAIEAGEGVRCVTANGSEYEFERSGYQHF